MPRSTFLVLFFAIAIKADAQQLQYPAPVEGDYKVKDFKFESGEQLPEMNIHYLTVGQPHKNSAGNVDNAVLITHGTTGNSQGLVSIARFSNTLFAPGAPLDAAKYYMIFIDGIGHGKSSKPSDGLHMKFSKYTYNDMVKAQYLPITQHLGINHVRLVMGTSMGGMHTWVWGYTYPDFMDALMPLASNPVEIAGRNRMTRKLAIDMIENDSTWEGGEYKTQPKQGLIGAAAMLMVMGSSPLQMQKAAPTRELEDAIVERTWKRYQTTLDANDVIYAFDASRYYNPAPHLNKIKAPLFAINSADDEVNPPEMGFMEREIKNVAKGRYILLPITDEMSGHGTHSNPTIWGKYLKELMVLTEQR